MSGFDRQRVTYLAAELEKALENSALKGAKDVLAQVQSLFDQIAAGQLGAPIRRAPGGRHFLESDLPSDPTLKNLWTMFCDAVEGVDTRRRSASAHPSKRRSD